MPLVFGDVQAGNGRTAALPRSLTISVVEIAHCAPEAASAVRVAASEVASSAASSARSPSEPIGMRALDRADRAAEMSSTATANRSIRESSSPRNSPAKSVDSRAAAADRRRRSHSTTRDCSTGAPPMKVRSPVPKTGNPGFALAAPPPRYIAVAAVAAAPAVRFMKFRLVSIDEFLSPASLFARVDDGLKQE